MAEAKSERRNLFLIGFSMFIMILLTAGLQTAAGVLFNEPLKEGSSWAMYSVMLVPQYLVAMPVAWLLLRLVPKTGLKKKSLSAGRFMIILMICYAILYAGNIIALIITAVINAISGKEMQNLVAEMVTGSDILANLLIAGIAAPVMEELFYRKLLIGRLRRYGDMAAIITSGLIFGLIHGNLSQFFYAFGLGVAFGYIYVRTAKISYTIALHIIINTVNGVLGPLLVQSGSALMYLYAMAVLGMAIAGTALFFVNKRRIWFAEGECKLEKWPSAFYLNPGMILFFIVCAAMFILNTSAALRG
jgi:membrane protease YdiL (CAAX protease family)